MTTTKNDLSTDEQIRIINNTGYSFSSQIKNSYGTGGVSARSIGTIQINMGKKCNMNCTHCHVNAHSEHQQTMNKATVDKCLKLIRATEEIHTVDITGGAPEMNKNFRYLVRESRRAGKRVIDRCNLTILEEEGYEDLAQFLAENGVEIIASLPHFNKKETDLQRGSMAYEKSILALKKLNRLGYGKKFKLNLVYNPQDIELSPPQSSLEMAYKKALKDQHNVYFDQLYCINNVPVNRHLNCLMSENQLLNYFDVLVSSYNPSALENLMCKDQISVSYDGQLYDCDFNQMLNIKAGPISSVDDFDYNKLVNRKIKTANHCWVCTAGAGSSCTGEIVGA